MAWGARRMSKSWPILVACSLLLVITSYTGIVERRGRKVPSRSLALSWDIIRGSNTTSNATSSHSVSLGGSIELKQRPHESLSMTQQAMVDAPGIDWTQFAYVQYATNDDYLCNSVMIFETIHRMHCRAERLLLYPQKWDVESDKLQGTLLRRARDSYGVTLKGIEVQFKSGPDATWGESYTKLLAFNQTQYARTLGFDSDSVALQCMDELFLSPPASIAMPRAYWLWHDHDSRGPKHDHSELTSGMLLLTPNAAEFNRTMNAVTMHKSGGEMDILNFEYLQSAMVLPHRPYILLTGEFRNGSHARWLGNPYEKWEPELVLKEAKFLHFSDWPIPKPWLVHDNSALINGIGADVERCDGDDCRNKDLWLGFYEDFRKRRKDVCDS